MSNDPQTKALAAKIMTGEYTTVNIESASLIDNEIAEAKPDEVKHDAFTKLLLTIGIDLSNPRTQLIVYGLGIFIFYMLYGMIQEHITRGDYNGEKFVFPEALVFVQCVLNAIFAKGLIKYVTKPPADTTSTMLYGACSFCYMGAMVSSNQALQYINYPTQVLGKSCKPIPVMLLGIILAKKRYPITKFICVVLIVIGVAMFMYKPNKVGADTAMSLGYGEMLLIVSLTLDGLTGATQEQMRSFYGTNQHHMMYNINLWSCGMLLAVLGLNGNGILFVQFLSRHPSVMLDLLLFSITSALGQHFIFLTVVKFGPLTCSIITTTRKFFTILASVILFQNPLTQLQWIGAICVFTGLAADAKYGKAIKKEEKVKTGK